MRAFFAGRRRWLTLRIDLINRIDRIAELGDVLEAAIDRRKTNVGNLVQTLELAHHQLANLTGIDFTLARGQQLLLDAVYGRIDRIGRHRSLAQRQHETAPELRRLEFAAAAILLDDDGHRQFDTLIGGEALVAMIAAAAAADAVPLVGRPGIHHLCIFVLAVRTTHGNSLLSGSLTLDRRGKRQ